MSICQHWPEKARSFRDLHHGDQVFLIPNPWDIGTARILARLGFQALATTSAGFAFSLGCCDGTISREATIAHVASIAAATPLPVSADLQNGFGDEPEEVAESIRLAAAAGAVGGSIEDATSQANDPIYARELATERIRAAAEAARRLFHDFVLTARAENYLHARPNFRDTIERLQMFQEAGADVLYAPGLKTHEEIQQLLRSVDHPINVLMGIPGSTLALSDLVDLGVKRVSLGSSLSRAAFGAFLAAAQEMRSCGTFGFAAQAIAFSDLNALFAQEPRC